MSLRPKLQLKRRFDYLKIAILVILIPLCRVSHFNQISMSTNVEIDSSKSKKKPASANPSGIRRGRKPYPIDSDGNKIRPEKENQKLVKNKSNQKNNVAKNF